MQLSIYRSLWGYPASVRVAAREIASGIYDGIELELPPRGPEQAELLAAVRDADLGLIPLISIDDEAPSLQLEAFRTRLNEVAGLEPDRVVMHTGQDFWPLTDAISFYEKIVEIEASVGVKVAHETHRGRPLATPWSTSAILDAVPELGLCCDFSHWVLVCERLLGDQEEAVLQAARHAIHLHARVGSDQAPQVQDPADPEAAPQVAAFERWWDMLWEQQAATGLKVSTLTPEYGPPPYQPVVTDPDVLAAKLSAICDWQAAREKKRFEERYG